MKKTTYNKLVRDKIPAIIRRNGGIPTMFKLSSKRFIAELKKKFFEEGNELMRAKNKTEIEEEISDVLEVLMALAAGEKVSWDAIERKRKEKREKRGGFGRKIFLKSVKE